MSSMAVASRFLGGFGGGRRLGFDTRDRAHAVVGVEVDDAYAHRVAPLRGDFAGVDADDLALGGDEQDVVALAHLQHADHGAVAAGGLDVADAFAAASSQSILLERRALAEAPLGDGQDLRPLLHDLGRDDGIVVLDVDPAHPARAAAPREDLLFREPNDHPELRGDHHLAGPVRAAGADHLVALLEVHGLNAADPNVGVGFQLGLLDLTTARGEQDVNAGPEIPHGHAGRYPFALTQGEQIDHGLALGGPAAFGDLVHLQPMDSPEVGEEEQVGMRRGDEEVLDDVLLLRLHAGHALAAAALAEI